MQTTITLNPTGGGTILSHDQIEALARGDADLKILHSAEYAHARSMKLTETERALFEAAKRSGYYRSEPAKVRVLAHYWLETAGRPSIEVKVHAQTATIEMDLISAPRKACDRWRDHPNLNERVRELAASFGARVKSDGLYNVINAVPVGSADACATSLCALYNELTRDSSATVPSS